ncbi:unnamed protein product [Phytophthora fragariaefolia]|uniref:Unnamed protein product n=1 Tax=Phytophthora fragariaefolia TaxID=1490495 RepID=A0A9W7CQ70_9STRA|nr:unnamed protein product [Phytophthora fragariaefolia]
MMEKDAEFLGAVEFSNEQQMQTTALRTVRDMIYAQLNRVPEDFLFLCQGREVEKVWEVDRRAWSIVPFALRGSPGLRTDILAKNRKLERPAVANPFEFRYMGNIITRYKKYVHDIKPVYKHRAFQLRKNAPRKHLEPAVEWRVATTWSGDWIYDQQTIKKKSKAEILKSLRTTSRPQDGVLVVKSHFGEILSPCSETKTVEETNEAEHRPSSAQNENTPPATGSKPEKRMQRIEAMSLRERKREDKVRKQKLQWKARLIAMEAQQQMEEKLDAASAQPAGHRMGLTWKNIAQEKVSQEVSFKTVLVKVEEENVLPSRLVPCKPKTRRRPKKVDWATYRWDIPGRCLSALPPSRKHLKVSKINNDISLNTPAGSSAHRQLGLGKFLSSTHIFLEENQVEVFPVLIIRPLEEQIRVNPCAEDVVGEVTMPSIASAEDFNIPKITKETLYASKTYLTEFEYDISATESNFELLYQHIASGVLQDAVWLNRRDVLGRTMLHDAAEFGHANVMELLLKARVVVDAKDSREDTPLHHAARHGRLKEVSMLLREHATPWLLNAEGKSPLYSALEIAAKRSEIPVSRTEGINSELTSVLKPAVERKNFFQAHRTYPQLRQVIDLLWDNYKLEHLVKTDSYARTNCLDLEKQVYGDLIEACRDGNLLRVQRLVDLEKRPVLHYINDQMEFLQRTALHEATEQGHTATVDLLLKLGANGCLRDQRLQAPLHLAAYKGNQNIVKCLMSKFPQVVSYQDIAGVTPLHLAIQQKHWNIATDLISLIQSGGEAIYHDSITGINVEAKRVSSLDLQDVQGYTALHYACINGNLEVCAALASAGAARALSQCIYRIPRGTPHLLGLWWKGDFKGIGSMKSLVNSSDQRKLIDIEAPVELLLRGWKQKKSNYQERLSILDLLLRPEHTGNPGNERSGLVKIAQYPLFHLAAELADDNISVAVEICHRLHKLQVMINMAHPQTNETVLLQECKRICVTYNGLSDRGDKKSDQLALVRCLLELGANVDMANESNGESPLGCAAWYGNLALLDLLLEAGADKNGFLRDCSFSPLHFAALGKNFACAKLLIGRSATVNVEMPPTNAETPLYFAIRSRSEEMVDLLLRSNADPRSLCTVQRAKTSFGIGLSLNSASTLANATHQGMIDHFHEGVDTAALVVSPLTFGLLVAQNLRVFGLPDVVNSTVERSQKSSEWKEMDRICYLLAQRLLEDTTGSKGVATRDDVHLASVLGFWKIVQLLLSHQITLSSAPSTFGMNALHLAAAAGQTNAVIALIASGMNVNCITRSDSAKPKKESAHRTWYEWIGCGHRGALYYSLIHGHTQTAAKLLVLGADAEHTIPHTRKKITWRNKKGRDKDKILSERIVVRFMLSEAMQKAAKTEQLKKKTDPTRLHGEESRAPSVDEASVNLIHLIECSLNQRVPLLHLVVALGHFTLARTLVEAGMSIFSGFTPSLVFQSGMPGWNSVAETPIHIAIACGHLEIVRYFATLVQNHFPGCFVREGKVFKSLLVTACDAHQTSILQFLLNDSDNRGGGFTYEICRDELQTALCTCAAVQFMEGFKLLISHGARPDAHTLVSALKGVISPSKHRMANPWINQVESLVAEKSDSRAPFPGERYQHDLRTHSIETAIHLLNDILLPECVGQIDDFIGASPVYELVQRILVICSRYQLWFVLDNVFIQHQDFFLDVASIWKPVLARAASSCFVLHRAALHNQLELVAFLLRLGIPANLQLKQPQSMKCPIWYAASRGSLQAFVYLALRSASFIEDLMHCQRLNSLPIVFRSINESCSSLSTSDTSCRWQNLSVFGCINVPKKLTNGYLIQKFINYGIEISHGHVDNSLLHHACRRGELIAVQTLVEGGADLAVVNLKGESPLEVASGRKDAFAISIVRYLLIVISQNKPSTAATIIDRALIRCFAQQGKCNISIAQALLNGGANPCYSYQASAIEAKICGCSQISAMLYALQSAQFNAMKLLLDHGAVITVPLSEAFLAQFLMKPEYPVQLHWKRFSKFLKHSGGKELLLEVESIMRTLLKKNIFLGAMNPDLLHQMLVSASALAATIGQEVELEKRFWNVVNKILDKYPKEISNRKAEWNQKAALHYAVACQQTPTIVKLLELRGFDLLAEDEKKQTPLHVAAAGGNEIVCRLLLAKLQSNTTKATAIDVPDNRGRTPLHLAVIHGHEIAANMILAAGASIDIRCHDGLTALLYATKCNRLAILIALHSRLQPEAREDLLTSNGEAGLFVAARHGASPVIRWFVNLYEEGSSVIDHNITGKSDASEVGLVFEMQCRFGRTILHYLAILGDHEILGLLLKAAVRRIQFSSTGGTSDDQAVQDIVNERDKCGYTPLIYAFAFGRLQVVRMLCEYGADPYVSIDHSGDPNAHPYTIGFDISGLLQWFALPGWYSFACKCLPPDEKPRLVQNTSIEDDYMLNSGYNYRKKQSRPSVEWRLKWKRLPAARLLKSEPRRRGKEPIRTTIRTWKFPQKSIFDYACEVGIAPIAEMLVNLQLPQLFRSLTYEAQRRDFMQAVRWNRIKIVQTLITSAAPGYAAIDSTTGNHFLDFLEIGIECAVSRGLEDMAMYLVSQWQGIKENGHDRDTPSAFAFQFAAVFQIACIRRLPKLMEQMIKRGGEELIEFHLNEGPALVYAFGFGHKEIVALLLRNGADLSIPTATYFAPSIRKWVEFESPKNVRVSWQPPTVDDRALISRPPFIGPLDTYEGSTLRLPLDNICRMFANIGLGDRAEGEDACDKSEVIDNTIDDAEICSNSSTDILAKLDQSDKDEAPTDTPNNFPGEILGATLPDKKIGYEIHPLQLNNNSEEKPEQTAEALPLNDATDNDMAVGLGVGSNKMDDIEILQATSVDLSEQNNDTKEDR